MRHVRAAEQVRHQNRRQGGRDGHGRDRRKQAVDAHLLQGGGHSATVYFAPAYDQNNVILTMERPGCKCDGCFDVMCRQLAEALPWRLLHVPRHVRRGGHAARRHGHGRAGRRAPERQAPRGHPPADAVLHAAHGRLHADRRRLPGAGRDALRADHGAHALRRLLRVLLRLTS